MSIVRAFDAERLARMEVEDARLVVQNYTFTYIIPCRGTAMSHWCVDVGGAAVEPRVCIDGARAWGGIDVLQTYRPHELALLEVYGTKGLTIRAYTNGHMEALARENRSVLGEEPGPQREGIGGLGWSTAEAGVGDSYIGSC